VQPLAQRGRVGADQLVVMGAALGIRYKLVRPRSAVEGGINVLTLTSAPLQVGNDQPISYVNQFSGSGRMDTQ
jgi:hypothetical protein